MKLRKRLPFKRLKTFKLLLKQKGQTIVEFVLLLAVISTLSYGFVAVMNSNIGSYWEKCVNIIVNDGDESKPKITIE